MTRSTSSLSHPPRDKSHHCSVIHKFDDGVTVVGGGTVVDVEAVPAVGLPSLPLQIIVTHFLTGILQVNIDGIDGNCFQT